MMELSEEKRFCECGCGGEVTRSKLAPHNWNRFISKHQKRTKKYWGIRDELQNPKLCECGCGEELIRTSNQLHEKRFIHGHQCKGKTHATSEETKRKIGESNRGKVRSEETKRKLSEAHKGQVPSAEAIAKMVKTNTGHTVSQETRDKISKANKGRIVSEETKRKNREGQLGKKMSEAAILKRSITQLENRQKKNKLLRADGYCDLWLDKEYIDDLRKTACEHCGITTMMSMHLFGERLTNHHTHGKAKCDPWYSKTFCRSCHSKLHGKLRREKKQDAILRKRN
jgi:hypothetical protein